MPASDFYNIGILDQQVVNLFYGWGYNFYRVENQLRADDQLVRAKACSFLGEARAAVVRAEAEFRRTRLPQPSRAKPFPDASVVGEAQSLERLSGAIGLLEGQMRNQPAPESDRMSELYRREGDFLLQLVQADHRLIGQSETLRDRLVGRESGTMLSERTAIAEDLRAIEDTLRARRALLLEPV